MLKGFGITGSRTAQVINNGHEHALRWDATRSKFSAPDHFARPYVFALGSRARHKQIDLLFGLAPALDALGIDLVVSGGQSSIFADTDSIAAPNVHAVRLRRRRRSRGPVRQRALLRLPLRTEGFGLPLLEAMVHGAPIVTSDCASMPEVCGEAALYAPADGPAVWLERIKRLAADPELRETLRARGRARYPPLLVGGRGRALPGARPAALAGRAPGPPRLVLRGPPHRALRSGAWSPRSSARSSSRSASGASSGPTRGTGALLAEIGPRRPLFLFLLLVLWIFGSAFLMPRLFAGTTQVFSLSRALDNDGGTMPLGPASGNLSQAVYAVGGFLVACTTAVFMRRAGGVDVMLRALMLVTSMQILFGALDLVTSATHTGFLLDAIHTGSYAFLTDDELGGLKRISGSFSEASAFATFSLTLLAANFTLFTLNVRPRFTGTASALLFGFIGLATSSAGYAGLAAFLAVFLGYAFSVGLLTRDRRLVTVAFGSVAAGVLMVSLVVLFLPAVADTAQKVVSESLLTKSTSDSAIERGSWNTQAWQVFLDTHYLGAGIGATRSSNYAMVLLSNLGIVGFGLFALILARLCASRLSPRLGDEGRALVWSAACRHADRAGADAARRHGVRSRHAVLRARRDRRRGSGRRRARAATGRGRLVARRSASAIGNRPRRTCAHNGRGRLRRDAGHLHPPAFQAAQDHVERVGGLRAVALEQRQNRPSAGTHQPAGDLRQRRVVAAQHVAVAAGIGPALPQHAGRAHVEFGMMTVDAGVEHAGEAGAERAHHDVLALAGLPGRRSADPDVGIVAADGVEHLALEEHHPFDAGSPDAGTVDACDGLLEAPVDVASPVRRGGTTRKHVGLELRHAGEGVSEKIRRVPAVVVGKQQNTAAGVGQAAVAGAAQPALVRRADVAKRKGPAFGLGAADAFVGVLVDHVHLEVPKALGLQAGEKLAEGIGAAFGGDDERQDRGRGENGLKAPSTPREPRAGADPPPRKGETAEGGGGAAAAAKLGEGEAGGLEPAPLPSCGGEFLVVAPVEQQHDPLVGGLRRVEIDLRALDVHAQGRAVGIVAARRQQDRLPLGPRVAREAVRQEALRRMGPQQLVERLEAEVVDRLHHHAPAALQRLAGQRRQAFSRF
ncbi:hypothetical protein MRB53_031086 [Persea americana]|uniref:Uncharacterized protein n=1 Tax=Persea americana TaxID=3435 RepID=A0ACC2KN48_PERAE|nr:hypothetical protein MRB53_031086 [Persea americana]